ncbi:chromosome segregation SMC family protein, partial [uncultured Megasphaera sp.]
MQVVKMELRGFKSFADKTVLTFDRGITAIVGPNGSGKSNISDAVRWVLGEQNVRQLRGQKAEDVIFSGTAQRRSQGVAEVSLYFDNQDNTLDIAFSEVVITRRLFRSGESEFYINKRPCRLKDIHRLFADTGMGQDSMAVIEQNRVDRILNSKPDERRIIFEEVAGISRFKGRKQDGLRKLAETERNLERVGDLMSVLAERLVPLAKEAATLQQFRSLDAERRAYEGTLTLQALRNSERLLAKFEYSLQEVVTEVRETRQAVALLEEKRQAALQQMAGAEQQAQQLDEAVLRVHNERDRLVQRRQACIQRQEELASSLQSLEEEQHLWQQKKDRLTALQAAQERQAAQRQKELDAARQRLALTQALFGKAEEKAQQTAAALAEVLADRQQQEQARLLAERDIQEWQRRLSENEKSGCRLQQDYEQARRRLQEAGTEKKEAEHRLQVWEHRQQEARIQYDRQEAALEKQRQACQRVRQDRQRRQEIETTAKQRLRVVQAMIQAHEGAGRAAKTILTATQVPWRAAVCGM